MPLPDAQTTYNHLLFAKYLFFLASSNELALKIYLYKNQPEFLQQIRSVVSLGHLSVKPEAILFLLR